MQRRTPPDGFPNWHRVDRSRFDRDVLRELAAADDPEGVTTSELARRLDLTRYEQDVRLRPMLKALEDAGLVEQVGGRAQGWHLRWRRKRGR